MLTIKEIKTEGYEKVIEGIDTDVGLHCFIAIHNTNLGPAVGGIRMYPYKSKDDALTDALRLAKAMTYKSAVAENGLGGGKSVIIGNPNQDKSPLLWKSFAKVLNSLNGLYIAAEDVGTTVEDITIIKKDSPFVAALPTENSSGDPSRFTAWGVFKGMQAVAQTLWNNPSLKHKTISIQGFGNVGSKLAEFLFWEGANLIICDNDLAKARIWSNQIGGLAINPDDIFNVECDIFAPCALGGIINDKTIPLLKCAAIAGCANNQLLAPMHGIQLLEKGILYAPDYIINAGGIINASCEFVAGGYNANLARDKTNHIYDTLMTIFIKSKEKNLPTNVIADELAEHKLYRK